MAEKAEKTCNNWQLSFMQMVVHKVGIWVKDTELHAGILYYLISALSMLGFCFHLQFGRKRLDIPKIS